MAKRFTDTNKWNKVWFRKLSPVHKAFWEYIRDRCSNAGVWEVDFETAEYYIRCTLDIIETKRVFKDQFVEIKDGKLWFIPDFVDFQYGELSESCNPHKPIISELKKLNLLEGYLKGFQTLKEKEKDKDKDIRGIAKGEWFDKLFWPTWPKKKSKSRAREEWDRIDPDEQLVAKILATIKRARTSEEWKENNGKYIPKPSNWLKEKGWEDEYKDGTNGSFTMVEDLKKEIEKERHDTRTI